MNEPALRNRVVSMVLGLAALTATASCGPARQADPVGAEFVHESATQILLAGARSMESVKALHVKGSITTGGSTYSDEVSVDRSGTCVGTISFGSNSAAVIVKDKTAYFRARTKSVAAIVNQFFYGPLDKAALTKMLAAVSGRWMAGPTNADIQSTCDLGELLGPMAQIGRALEAQPHSRGFTKGQVKILDGVQAVAVEASDSRQRLSFWIATQEPHYLVMLSLSGAQQGSSEFSAFGVPVTPRIPTGAEVVELSKLRSEYGSPVAAP